MFQTYEMLEVLIVRRLLLFLVGIMQVAFRALPSFALHCFPFKVYFL